MSKRPPNVKVGDRVRLTTVHTGVITGIGDDGFQLQTSPGRPVNGSFHGDGEMTWVVLPPPPPAEPDDGAVVRLSHSSASLRVFERDDQPGSYPRVWYGAGASGAAWSWAEVCELGTPVELVAKTEQPC